eukprot:TRINITY_DN9187_c0_g1_i1.p1 TRINITY_DN9187_c0_g1~~TRINITY_DN9187_c0_g1_i1.p1  ORF type:complete len:467 (-),score=58.01 TRINITY_DN9187_c0_g1_i1:52-1452(-)
MSCPFEGSDCEQFIRKDLNTHKNVCSYRKVPCELCKLEIAFKKIQEHQDTVCPMFSISCSNNCGVNVLRKDVKTHIETECDLQVISCGYAKYDCCFSDIRKKVNQHCDEDVKKHLELVEKKFAEVFEHKKALTEKNAKLNEELTELRHSIQGFLPNLPHAPLNSPSVILPSSLRDQIHSEFVVVTNVEGENLGKKRGRIVYTKPEGTSFFMKSKVFKPITIPADRVIPKIMSSNSLFYFEILVETVSNTGGAITIGIVPKFHSMHNVPGVSEGSYGFCSNGYKYCFSDEGKGKEYAFFWGGIDAVVGCGWDQKSGNLFFTLNGQYLGKAFTIPKYEEFYPAIGFSSRNSKVVANFGQRRFEWLCEEFPSMSAKEEGLQKALEANVCTYSVSSSTYVPQYFYHCFTCGLSGNTGMCQVCVTTCHNGHKVSQPIYSPGFFCDCGDGACEKNNGPCKSLQPGFLKEKNV